LILYFLKRGASYLLCRREKAERRRRRRRALQGQEQSGEQLEGYFDSRWDEPKPQ
jgi:hypothetical protein